MIVGVLVDTRGFFPAIVFPVVLLGAFRAALHTRSKIGGGLPRVPLCAVLLVCAIVLARQYQYNNRSQGSVVPLTAVGGDVVVARKFFAGGSGGESESQQSASWR